MVETFETRFHAMKAVQKKKLKFKLFVLDGTYKNSTIFFNLRESVLTNSLQPQKYKIRIVLRHKLVETDRLQVQYYCLLCQGTGVVNKQGTSG